MNTNTYAAGFKDFNDNMSTAYALMSQLNKSKFSMDSKQITTSYHTLGKLTDCVEKVRKYAYKFGGVANQFYKLKKQSDVVRQKTWCKIIGGTAGCFTLKILPYYAGVVVLSKYSLDGKFARVFDLTTEDVLRNAVPTALIGASLGVLSRSVIPVESLMKNIAAIAKNSFLATAYLVNATLTAPCVLKGTEMVSPENSLNVYAGVGVALAAESMLRLVGGY